MATNKNNGKRYIGVTGRSLAQRKREHFCHAVKLAHNGHFYRSIRKNGKDVFVWEVLTTVETREEAKSKEIELIAFLKPEYNSTLGGGGQFGVVFSEEARKKMGQKNIGNKYHKDKKHSEDTKNLLRELGYKNKEKFFQYSHLGSKASSKEVICIDDGKIFPSASEAARNYGVAKSALVELCLKKNGRKTVGKRRFEYLRAA